MLQDFLKNHVLANLTFALVLIVGFLSYALMPREQDPTINFNWIQVTTVLPGASARDVEKRVTDPLEEEVRKISDIRFVSSNSRESISSILVRFNDVDERTFDKRVNDLRREIQNKQDELPEEAEDPDIFEITSANAFPSAILLVTGLANDENLRRQAHLAQKDVERFVGVDRVLPTALLDPELQIDFFPQRLYGLGVAPTDLADTVAGYFRDIAAGSIRVVDQDWLVRLQGADPDPDYIAQLPIIAAQGEVPLGSVAEVTRGREKASTSVAYEGRPAVLLSVMKQAKANTLELVARVKDYAERRNRLREATGVRLVVADDQTEITRNALNIMQTNAALGLFFVVLVTWLFLGARIALLTSIGIPFILAGTFWFLNSVGETLNVSVLLGVVISLGMLVDDAVVVVEGIYYRLQRGMEGLDAATNALREVFMPVTTAVLTTMAAFLPLMLLPGILGQFMRVIPVVVTVALAISLVEAYWMLPAHMLAARVRFDRPTRIQQGRVYATHWLRVKYTRLLVRVLRYPKASLAGVLLLFILAGSAVALGKVHMDFFASDPIRLFYVNVQMPVGTPLEKTLKKVQEVERKVRAEIRPGEVRALVSYAGQMVTETEPLIGEHHGQLLVSLNPQTPALRNVDAMIEALRAEVTNTPGPVEISFLRLAGGPPTGKPISVKVRGDDYAEIRAASDDLREILAAMPAVSDISDDAGGGRMELVLRINRDAVQRAGLDPAKLARTLRLLVDGEIAASVQHQGEEVEVRVRAKAAGRGDIESLLDHPIPLPEGGETPLRELVHSEAHTGPGNFRHYNFRRAITLEADLDKTQMDTVTANAHLLAGWSKIAARYPDIDLDFSGVLDDIQESLDAIGVLFLLGLGLMYLLLGTQFRSYWQPLMILITIPMAFTGVVMGLFITGNPLSLFTLYGVVALAGIAVNSAIVLISAANLRLEWGMSVLHATIYSARRRVIPILITSLTTVAGLFSLATGLGGHSLLWGPVATAIVWGLGFSTVLTLLVIPLLYRLFMGRSYRLRATA